MGAPTRVGRAAGLYLPSGPERLGRVYMMVHLRADPLTFVPALREIATAVDPTLRLSEVQRVDQVTDDITWVLRLWLRVSLARHDGCCARALAVRDLRGAVVHCRAAHA